jgi:hypothetical protein
MVLSLRKYPRSGSQPSQLIYITRERVTESVLENILECAAEPATGKYQSTVLQDFCHQTISVRNSWYLLASDPDIKNSVYLTILDIGVFYQMTQLSTFNSLLFSPSHKSSIHRCSTHGSSNPGSCSTGKAP